MNRGLSDFYVDKMYQSAHEAGEEYIETLYNVLRCIDLSSTEQLEKAQRTLRLIGQVQMTLDELKTMRPAFEE